ncbi:hypothetical protein [Psychrobacillus lasiicapitis]|uniref:Uncharacterized protein n=1 Tax=Psychrobacillus lasiicapitis TaxID=1636719 RepID=A0A544TI73_9BACI|nr:hypothetical protein [Psychrobacillus lasiicapitis]TQR17110.1 hypothetical protein FG382_02905 [Psychrobacillus lasiicapitis]GGA24417.1 hypothetical protein GCM10011384_11980 [Psychrobacillus lasiicapitis]
MSERFDLSFKNKEVRVWFYLAIPTFIIVSIIIFYTEQNYQFIPILVFWMIFYIWRFFHRRKQKKEQRTNSS